MAVFSNTYQTYSAAGIREDLIDVITNIDPVDTFCLNNFGTAKAKNTYHEWQTDALAAAAANAYIEGDEATAAALTKTTRTGNTCQILRKVFVISDTLEAVDKAGRNSEVAYQTQKTLKELARDIEYALVVNSASATGASGTARQMKGLVGWISDNASSASATTVDITESALNDNLALIWADGGKPSTILCGAYQKRKISAFTTNTREISAETKKLVSAVDIYKSDFGTLNIKLHHQLNTSLPGYIVILGEMDLWKKAWLRPIKREELARTGAAKKFMVEAELTLESRQEKGSGMLYGYKPA